MRAWATRAQKPAPSPAGRGLGWGTSFLARTTTRRSGCALRRPLTPRPSPRWGEGSLSHARLGDEGAETGPLSRRERAGVGDVVSCPDNDAAEWLRAAIAPHPRPLSPKGRGEPESCALGRRGRRNRPPLPPG